eukprot:TRINITY_DN3994_c0_g1_i2.p1 TRINITY_DN3994_c0_g1~~TRINITY_DN3994_c0_g1_i2.p1  ORF type:complete len:121 (+),score=4.35 TRINITY_DN3994_c0_g1_i2:313-675(+)
MQHATPIGAKTSPIPVRRVVFHLSSFDLTKWALDSLNQVSAAVNKRSFLILQVPRAIVYLNGLCCNHAAGEFCDMIILYTLGVGTVTYGLVFVDKCCLVRRKRMYFFPLHLTSGLSYFLN